MNWTSFSTPISVRVARTPDEGHHPPGYVFFTVDVIAWRWDEDKNNVEYLDLRGFRWPAMQYKDHGVTRLAERKQES